MRRKRSLGTRLLGTRSSRYRQIQKLESRCLLAGDGLLGQYYDSDDLTAPAALTRVDPAINFDWDIGSPGGSVGADQFSVRWSGQVEAEFTETFTFIVNANDGARLWVNGELLVDKFESGSLIDASSDIDLIAGRRYDIQLEYVEDTGVASAMLEWSSPSVAREVIPSERLYAADRGSILLQQWSGITGTTVADLTSNANYPSNPSSVSSLTSLEYDMDMGDDLGQRLQGYLHAPLTGPYTFHIAADESAEFWLSNTTDSNALQLTARVDSATGFQQWDAAPEQTSDVVYLAAGQKYAFDVLHKESSGADHLSVAWTMPGESTPTVITDEHLSPVLPNVQIYSVVPAASESANSPMRFDVVRSGTSLDDPLTVAYSLSGDATNGVDYQSLSGTITIPAGQSRAELTVTPLADSLTEGDETIVIEIDKAPGYDVGLKSQRTANGKLQDDIGVVPGGTTLWNADALSDFTAFGGTFTTEFDATHGDVIQVVVPAGQANPWDSQLRQGIDDAVTAGDIVWASFLARTTSGTGTISAVFETNGAPFTKSLNQAVPLNTDWTRVEVPFYAAETYAVGEATFGFHLAYGAQTVQFADFSLLNYGPPKTLAPESDFNLNNITGTFGVSQNVSVTGQPFAFAYQVETQTVPTQVWHLQAVERNEGVIANGDTVRFEFSARAIAGASPQAGFAVQRTDTFATLTSQLINLTSNWQSFSIDLTVTDDFDVDGLQAVFNLGYGLQTVEIGGFHWTNLNNAADLDELPEQIPSVTYDGRGGTDPWRDTADSRIENNRKSQLTVSVTDVNGNPLDGAVVSVRQNKHEFLFGSAINAFNGKLDPNGTTEALKYQSEIKRLFNAAVLENSLKWPQFLGDRNRGIEGVQFATDNDLYLRGHNVIWPSRTYMPDSVWSEYDTRVVDDGLTSANAWLETTINARIDDVLNEFDGEIPEWDVVNEPYTNHEVMDILGDSIMVDWYQRIRTMYPTIKLALNDFSIFARNGGDTAHRASFDYWLGLLNTNNLLDIIGEQSHYNENNLTDITVLDSLINTYNTQFNAPIAITEFDVNTVDEQLQADYLRDYMTMAFSQPAVEQFLHWGFWESSHWLPDAALYRSDFSIKPNGQAYEDLVFGEWWTDIQGTSRSGQVETDAFLGEYDVVVQYNGQSYTATAVVDDSGTSAIIVNVPQSPINYAPIVSVENASVLGDTLSTLTNTGTWFESENENVTFTASLGSASPNNDGTWSWSFTPTQHYANQQVTITVTDSRGASTSTEFTISTNSVLHSTGVSYGGSSFGDNAIATNKTALLPGGTSTMDNYTSYHLGLNRVIVQLAGVPAANSLTADDFEFRVGNTDDPTQWQLLDSSSAIPLPTISVSASSTPGVDQVMLTWPNNAIENTWLQTTVKANANTGLVNPSTFYFGNQIGDVDGGVNGENRIRVSPFDTIKVRANQTPGVDVDIENLYDVDRNGTVGTFDTIRVRLNQSLGGLLMFSPPLATSSSSSFSAGFQDSGESFADFQYELEMQSYELEGDFYYETSGDDALHSEPEYEDEMSDRSELTANDWHLGEEQTSIGEGSENFGEPDHDDAEDYDPGSLNEGPHLLEPANVDSIFDDYEL